MLKDVTMEVGKEARMSDGLRLRHDGGGGLGSTRVRRGQRIK